MTAPFSVLIPVYIKENSKYFEYAINSILNQTLLPAEIVVVEDGPLTGDLYRIIDTYKNAYSGLFNFIRISENKGMGVAMQLGLENCNYNIVARMDSDDICVEDRFELQYNYLLNNPSIDAVGGQIKEFIYEIGDCEQERRLPLNNDAIIQFAKFRNPMNHMTVMFKKDKALNAGGYWHYRVLEDYNLWFRMLLNGCLFANIDKVLVYARIGTNMIGRRKGLYYLKMELYFFKIMYRENFITFLELVKNFTLRSVMKVIPLFALQKMYSIFLRNRQALKY
jgi:glycosyltransferase involved in cell wall biosynthesis